MPLHPYSSGYSSFIFSPSSPSVRTAVPWTLAEECRGRELPEAGRTAEDQEYDQDREDTRELED